MRDAQVRRVPVVNDMGRLVAAISIDDLVLVAQNVRASADAASVVGFHAVGRVERRERGVGSLSRFRDGVDHLFVAALVASGVRRAGIDRCDPHRMPTGFPRAGNDRASSPSCGSFPARAGIDPRPASTRHPDSRSPRERGSSRNRAPERCVLWENPRAGNNATGRLIDSRSCVVEPLPPAGGGGPVGRRPRTDSAGSSKSLNLCAELGQLQFTITRLSGQPRPGAPSRVRPTRGGKWGEHIRPQHRAGGQAVPGARISTSASPHDRARFDRFDAKDRHPQRRSFSNERGDPQLETGRSRPAGLPTRE